jgi:glycerophosphoryl diester phosphodiesterase
MKPTIPGLVACLLLTACGGEDTGTDASTDPGQEDGCEITSALDPDVTFPGAGEASVTDCVLDMTCTEVLVCAHRGLKVSAPENSLPAVRDAVDLGLDLVEVDVRDTADDRLVIMHDDTVDRTTDGTGRVDELTFDEIRALHLDTSGIPGFTGEDFVPAFEEVLDIVRGRSLVYLDMKTDRVDLLVPAIQEAAAQDFVLVYSGSLSKLEAILAADPTIHVFPSADDIAGLEAIMAVMDPSLVEMGGELDPAFSARAHELGVKVSRDTMTRDLSVTVMCDPSYWDLYLEGGIDVLQTNWPQYMLPYVK